MNVIFTPSTPPQPPLLPLSLSTETPLNAEFLQMIRNLPQDEKDQIKNKSFNPEELDAFVQSIENSRFLESLNLDDMQELENDIAGLSVLTMIALRENKISVATAATIHMLIGAIVQLFLEPKVLTDYSFNNIQTNQFVEAVIPQNLYDIDERLYGQMPFYISSNHFTFQSLITPAESGKEADKILFLLQHYFDFDHGEWEGFCNLMTQESLQEQQYFLIPQPRLGVWSALIERIKKMVSCFRSPTRIIMKEDGRSYTATELVIPSFSMMQNFLKVKSANTERKHVELIPAPPLGVWPALTEGLKKMVSWFCPPSRIMMEEDGGQCIAKASTERKPVKLVPVFGEQLLENRSLFKAAGQSPLGLYLPELSLEARDAGRNRCFMKDIDGYKNEGPFSAWLYQCYQALLDQEMVEMHVSACIRLAAVINSKMARIENQAEFSNMVKLQGLLVHGGLIHSLPSANNVFYFLSKDALPAKFGDLFKHIDVQALCRDSLKDVLIQDMVDYEGEWKENFTITQDDLNPPEQELYQKIEKSNKKKRQRIERFLISDRPNSGALKKAKYA